MASQPGLTYCRQAFLMPLLPHDCKWCTLRWLRVGVEVMALVHGAGVLASDGMMFLPASPCAICPADLSPFLHSLCCPPPPPPAAPPSCCQALLIPSRPPAMHAVCTLVACHPQPMSSPSAPSSATHWQRWGETQQDQVRESSSRPKQVQRTAPGEMAMLAGFHHSVGCLRQSMPRW